MRFLLSYSGSPIPKTLPGPPEEWSPEDVAYLCQEDSADGDLAARAEPLPAWLVRRRVRVGRNLKGEPLARFAELTLPQQEDALESAEDWTQRPPLLLPDLDQWAASQRALRILQERCPDVLVRPSDRKLCDTDGCAYDKARLRLVLTRATGTEPPNWLLVNILDGGIRFETLFPFWDIAAWDAKRKAKRAREKAKG